MDEPVRVISRRRTAKSLGGSLREVWARRSLLGALVARDVQSKYVGTVLGVAWIVIQPALLVAFYTFVFSVVFKVRMGVEGPAGSSHAGYALFVLGGLTPWLTFSNGLQGAARSIVQNKAIVTKVVFPVELLPMSAVASAQVGFLAMTAIVLAIAGYTVGFSPQLLWIPLLAALLVLLSLGAGYVLAVVSTFVKDVSNVIPFLMTLWMYGSPILYSPEQVPESFRPILALNPIAPVIEAYRGAILYGRAPDVLPLACSAASAVILFIAGFWLFRRAQTLFSEVL